MSCSFDVLHGLVAISSRTILIARQVADLLLNIDLFALEEGVDDFTEFQIPRTEPCWVTLGVLTSRLHPIDLSLGA